MKYLKTLVIVASLAIAPVAVNAQSIGIGGGLGTVGLSSGTVGQVSGSGINGGATFGPVGATQSQTTQTAGTTGLAGTKLTLGVTGPSIVSEHNVAGFSQQTTVGSSLGNGFSGGIGGSAFSGMSLSQGSFTGVGGFLGFGLQP